MKVTVLIKREHDEVADLFDHLFVLSRDKLLVRQPGDDELPAIVRVAHELFVMHARDEEEAEILPVVDRERSAEDLGLLATDLLAEQARIRPRVLRTIGMPARAA